MATEQTIMFNYNQAIAQAEELIGIAKEIKKVADGKFEDSVTQIDSNWDGQNSKKFVTKCNDLKGKMEDSSSDITKIAEAIKQIAKAIRDAELANIATAKTKTAK